jgi:formate dehydrogenase assembly factor FdhD
MYLTTKKSETAFQTDVGSGSAADAVSGRRLMAATVSDTATVVNSDKRMSAETCE